MNELLRVCDRIEYGSDLLVDFLGRGNIWIENTYDSDTINLARSVLYNALKNTSVGQLNIIGYDADLSGIFAPFASISSGEMKQLEILIDGDQFKKCLNRIRFEIQEVQNLIQGRFESLIEFRRETNRPIERFNLVVVVADIGIIDREVMEMLALLMRSGPSSGFSFLIVSSTNIPVETKSGKEINLSVHSLAPNISILKCLGRNIEDEEGKSACFSPVSVNEIITMCDSFVKDFQTISLPMVRFEEVNNMQLSWENSSTDGIVFSVGKYGLNNMEITIGDEINQRHNALITGAVGQGKSNLISVIIHSMCLRYSPEELQLFLLDYKEGVSFKPFLNIESDVYLPHAKALGLESDVSFGKAVLEYLYNEYQVRMKLFKENNVKSIRDYKLKKLKMPRIVVIIDEFQLMFGDDNQEGSKIVDLLEKSVRLFRAAGIHYILSSQSLSGNIVLSQKKESIFGQIPIRIALKNSIIESQQSLSIGNVGAAHLRPREAIVNVDYGDIAQNKKTIIAYADEDVLEPMRETWWEKCRMKTCPPMVFESEKRKKITDRISSIKELKHSENVLVGALGEKISVSNEQVCVRFLGEPGRNVAILGTSDSGIDQAVGIMQSIALSIALNEKRGNIRFVMIDFRNDCEETMYSSFFSIMKTAGYFVERIMPGQFESFMEESLSDVSSDMHTLVFAIALDRWEYEKDPYGQGSSLKNYVENCSSMNIHFIGWWMKVSNYIAQVSGFSDSDAFNTKVFLRMPERDVQSLTNPFVRWSPQVNRAMVFDSVEMSEESIIIPYAPLDTTDIGKIKQ